MTKHLGSTAALVLGVLSLISGLIRPSGVLIAGIVIILGALAYRSAKKRKLGEVKSTSIRLCAEAALVLAIFPVVLAQNNLKELIATDPVPNAIIPLLAIVAYLFIALRKTPRPHDEKA